MDQRPHMRVTKIKAGCADKASHYNHWLQPLQAAFKKPSYPELAPSVIVSVTYHKPRQKKEKINGQITMINQLLIRAGGICLTNMEQYNSYSGNPAKPVQYRVMWFGFYRICVRHFIFELLQQYAKLHIVVIIILITRFPKKPPIL